MQSQDIQQQRFPWLWPISGIQQNPAERPVDVTPNQIQVKLLAEGGAQNSLELKATDRAILGPGFELKYNMIRNVTKECRALCTEEHSEVIMVSTRRVLDKDASISNMYILADNAEETQSILKFFEFHLLNYFKAVTGEQDPSVLLQLLRPVMMTKLQVKLHRRKEKQTLDGMRIVVLDQECFALYERPYQESPSDVMFFWREFYTKSCSKVSTIHSMDVVLFQSEHLFVVIECKREGRNDTEDLEKAIKDSNNIPKPWKAFQDAAYMLKVLTGVEDPMEVTQAPEAELETPAAVQEQRPVQPPIPEGQAIALEPEDSEKLDRFAREIREGLDNEVEVFRTMWQNRKEELKRDSLNSSPADLGQWSFNPNSVDEFLKAMQEIHDQVFLHADYKKGLEITRTVQDIFIKSRVQRLRTLAEEGALELLQKIYARGNRRISNSSEALVMQTSEEALDYELEGADSEMEEVDDEDNDRDL